MSEKTEGSFKIQTKPKLTEEQMAAKNKEPLVDVPSNVTDKGTRADEGSSLAMTS